MVPATRPDAALPLRTATPNATIESPCRTLVIGNDIESAMRSSILKLGCRQLLCHSHCSLHSGVGVPFPERNHHCQMHRHDTSQNTSSANFTVTVLDKEAPVVDCAPARSPTAKIPAGQRMRMMQEFWDHQLSARDNCDPNPKIYIKDSAPASPQVPTRAETVRLTHARGEIPNPKKLGMVGLFPRSDQGRRADLCR